MDSRWEEVEFRSLAASERSSFSMGPFGSKITKENYIESGVPVVRGTNLSQGIFLDSGFVFISDEKADELSSANVKPGALIFTHRGTIGQVSMIPRKPRYDRYIIGSSQVKAELDAAVACPEFYYYWFRSPRGQNSILANVSTVGVPGLATPLSTIRALRVPKPALKEQRAIAEVLQSLDEKIAGNEHVATVYERILALHFEALASDIEVSIGSVAASEIIEFNPKLSAPSRTDATYLDMAALSTSAARVDSFTRRAPKSGTRFQNGDTVMARITPCLENGKTAYVDFMPEGEVGIGSTEFIVMRPRIGIPKHFPYFLARSSRFRSIAIRNMVGSSGRQRVSASQLQDVPLVRPAANELAKFDEVASHAFTHMKSLGSESKILAELRDTLLPKLMSGELRVRDAERLVEDAV